MAMPFDDGAQDHIFSPKECRLRSPHLTGTFVSMSIIRIMGKWGMGVYVCAFQSRIEEACFRPHAMSIAKFKVGKHFHEHGHCAYGGKCKMGV